MGSSVSDQIHITIRRVEPDADECRLLSNLAIRSKAYWNYNEEFLNACRDELTVRPEFVQDNPTFVIECDGRITGFYSIGQVLDKRDDNRCELDYLFVEPKWIGKGLGRRLIEHAKVEARRIGYDLLEIQGDPNAEPFYLAVGAEKIGKRESLSVKGRYLPVYEIDLRD